MKSVKSYLSVLRNKLRKSRPGSLTFQCNICSAVSTVSSDILKREEASCSQCGSTVRMRSIIHVLSTELFGASLTLDAFPVKKHLTGIGMSDWGEYARRLSKKFNYRNTFYHKEPRLDITNLYDQELELYDFVISSDVFEHVVPPVGRAFHNLYKIMRPGGVCIFTVPYTLSGTTVEHFPDLFDYVISERENNYYLRNVTKAGHEQIFDSLVFHGGPGSTLEMRVFSQQSLLECCHAAGFSSTVIYGEPFFKFGIYWPQPWSLPMALRR